MNEAPEKIRLFWYKRRDLATSRNFGDALSPLLCGHLSGAEIVHAEADKADMIAIGSILGKVPDSFFFRRKIYIWGSGFIHETDSQKGVHDYLALRGRLTAARVKGLKSTPALGDPGLLVDRMFPQARSTEKKFAYGIIPHHVDRDEPGVLSLGQKLPDSTIIDIHQPPERLVQELTACEFIVASCLHGLVAADAFGIPNAWVCFSQNLKGGRFKFHDYYSAYGIQKPLCLEPSGTDEGTLRAIAQGWGRQDIEKIKDDLVEAFPFKKYRSAAPY